MFKFCPECGSRISGGKFCGNCGADLSKYGADNAAENATNTGSTLDDALQGLNAYAEEKAKEETIARDFEIENGVLKKYKGAGGNVVIPDCVTSIGEKAFWGCGSLTMLTIPNGVTSIGEYAFRGCENLSSVKIGKNVSNIGVCIFVECPKLKNIYYMGDIKSWCEIEGVLSLFPVYPQRSTLYIDNEIIAGNLRLPYGIKRINEGAFYNCLGLKSVVIPDSVYYIGDWAFESCDELESISIPGNCSYESNSFPPYNCKLFKR